MERSTNYNLYLPSSDDDDLAEVNELSSNFEAIDTVLGDKEELTTDETETFVGAINEVNGKIPTIDQTYSPTSANAQSGVAVAEAISAIRVETMPEETPLEDEGKIVQYIGNTTTDYINGYFYRAVDNGDACVWKQHNVQPQVDNEIFVADENTTYTDILDAIGMFEGGDPHAKAVFYKLITEGNYDIVHYLPLGSIDDSQSNFIQFCGLISYITVPNEFEACCVKIDTDDERIITYKRLYTKPVAGIPKTDLTSAVQASLNKADTALQSDDIDQTYDPTSENAQSGKAVAEALSTSVSYSAQTDKTEMQKAQARQNINASAPDGYYGESGGVYQYSTNFVGKNLPQNAHDIVYRPTASQLSGQNWTADSVSGQTATIEKIKGKTLVFNQLVQNGNFVDKNNWNSASSTFSVSNNEVTINATAVQGQIYQYIPTERIFSNHKYFCAADIQVVSGDGVSFNAFNKRVGRVTTNKYQRVQTILTNLNTTYRALVIASSSADGVIKARNVIVVDLTQMYGAGKEPTTVEEFKAQFPLEYYQYNAGELISLNATGLKTTGFNQLYLDGHIDVIKGVTYKIEGTYTSLKDSAGNDVAVLNGEFTPSANDTYTMLGGSCVHIKWSGVRDGETEQHWNSELSLPIATYFEDGMKSNYDGNYCDELLKDKAVKRIKAYTFTGTEPWSDTQSAWGTGAFKSLSIIVDALPHSYYSTIGLMLDGMTEVALMSNDAPNLSFTLNSYAHTANTLAVKVSSCTTVEQIKEYMRGKTLYYILAEPIETPISPELNLTYRCDDFGTEMLLPQNDDEPVTAPMDADIVYQLDYEANIRNMDINTISKASMDNFISAFNISGLGTIMQVWDDTNKRYTYTVSPPAPVQ